MATISTKKAKASASVTNAVVDFFLADDVRLESSGKVTVVGLYPDSVMVVLLPPDAPEPSKESPYGVDAAAFLVNIRNLVGTHDVFIQIGGEGNAPDSGNGPVRQVHFADLKSSANLVGRFRPLLIASFGVKTVTINIDGVEFKRTFEVRRGVAPVNELVAVDAAPAAPKKKASRARQAH